MPGALDWLEGGPVVSELERDPSSRVFSSEGGAGRESVTEGSLGADWAAGAASLSELSRLLEGCWSIESEPKEAEAGCWSVGSEPKEAEAGVMEATVSGGGGEGWKGVAGVGGPVPKTLRQ